MEALSNPITSCQPLDDALRLREVDNVRAGLGIPDRRSRETASASSAATEHWREMAVLPLETMSEE